MVARRMAGSLLAALAALAVASVWGEGPSSERLKALQSDPVKLRAAVESGKRLASFCANCHGEGGVSKIPEVPSLAGQHPVYLLEQIRKFGSGERRDPFMQGLIKVLKDDERMDLALYYASTAVPVGKGDPALATIGKDAFGKLCSRCHGDQGHGTETVPRLAGQQVEYLKRSIVRYRDGTGERNYPLMQIAVSPLTNDEIATIANYLARLP